MRLLLAVFLWVKLKYIKCDLRVLKISTFKMIVANTTDPINPFYTDLVEAIDLVYNKCGFKCSDPIAEVESTGYGAYTFLINGNTVKYRVANITPTKTGQFVTLWKRAVNGPIQPFDISDNIKFYIISTKNDHHAGQFIFPESVLYGKGILSGNNKEGKRATRVYPPWDIATSRQALQTQQWQSDYFLMVPKHGMPDLVRAKMLLAK